jgi:hypothetical protein
MPQLPLINRAKAAYILDTDILEIQRQLPNGDILALKTNVSEVGGGSCPEYQVYEESREETNLNEKLQVIPRLPTKTCYGASKSICKTTWINSSYDLNLSVLKETSSDTLAEYLAHATLLKSMGTEGEGENMILYLIQLHQAYVKELIEMRIIINEKITFSNDTRILYDNLAPLYNISCIEKWTASALALEEAFAAQIAEVEEKIAGMQSILNE